MNKEDQIVSITSIYPIGIEHKNNDNTDGDFIDRFTMKLKSINWSLSNKIVFVSLIVFSIMILTGINNFYFYSHVARENNRNAEKIRIIVDEKLALCADNNIDLQSCTSNIVSTIEKVSKHYYYVTNATLLDYKGNILWEKAKNSHDKVAALSVNIQLPDLKESSKAKIDIENRWSDLNIFLSVYRSMTFSITQLIEMSYNDGMKKSFKYFTTVAWYRSRPAIGFAFFSIILFYLYRKRETARKKEVAEAIAERDMELVRSEQLRIDKDYENKTLQQRIKDLEIQTNNVVKKIKKYDNTINPPLNTLKYEQFLELDPESVIFKCRKVAEKFVIQLYNKKFKHEDRLPLYKKIERLSKASIIDSMIVTQINTIKAFGNLSAHPNVNNPIVFTREGALMVSSTLILLIEELESKGLLIE